MKKLLFPIFFLLFSISLSAQKIKEEQLLGSWRIYGGTILHSDSMRWQVISFFSDYEYQAFYIVDVYDTLGERHRHDTIKESGLWELSKKGGWMWIYNRHTQPDASHSNGEKELYCQVMNVDDTSLVLGSTEGDTIFSALCSRTAPVGKLKMNITPGHFEHGEITEYVLPDIYLVNSMDTTKRVRLKGSVTITLECPPDTAIENCETTYDAYVESVTDTTFSASISMERRNTDYKNGATDEYYNPHDNDNAFTVFSYRQVKSIDYVSSGRDGLTAFFAMTAFGGFVTAFLVAPLISIQKHWGFNEHRYFMVAGIGLGSFAVCLPLASIFSGKEYRITSRNGFKSSDYWYFQQY